MRGPPLGPGGEDISWPEQVAPRGRNASITRNLKPHTPTGHPPLTQDLTKPALATAQPAEPEPNPTGQAARPSVYISHPTHRAGPRPAANCSTNSNPVSQTECRPVLAPTQRRQREEQANPPRRKNKQKTRKGGNPRPTTNTCPLEKKKGRGERESHNREAAHALDKRRATSPGQATRDTTPRGPPKERRRTTLPDQATPTEKQRLTTTTRSPKGQRRGHPGHAGAHPTGGMAGQGKEKKHRRNPNERGRGDGDQGAQDRDRQRRTPQSQDTTENHNPPSQPEKKTKGMGGEKPRRQRPRHNPTPQAAPQRGGGIRTGRAQEDTRPNTPTRRAGCR